MHFAEQSSCKCTSKHGSVLHHLFPSDGNLAQAVEGEVELMQCMRTKLGPYASEAAIQYHLRSARGKVFWAGASFSGHRNVVTPRQFTIVAAAVNTYFRAVLAEQVRQADFEPKEYAQLANCRTPAPPNLMQGSGSREQSSFDSIPSPVLEHVLRHCNLLTVCNAASACSSLHQVSSAKPVLLCSF